MSDTEGDWDRKEKKRRLCRIQNQDRTKNLKYRRRLCRIQDYEKTTVKMRDTGE